MRYSLLQDIPDSYDQLVVDIIAITDDCSILLLPEKLYTEIGKIRKVVE